MAFDLSSITSHLTKALGSSSRRKAFLGVDIGASAIKIVQVKLVKGVPTLETYGELQLGPYEGGDIGKTTNLPQNKLVEALFDIVREASATATDVAFAFSYNSSFTQVITIPSLDQNQLGTMITVEARKYIPLALSRVTLDWIPVGVNEEKKQTEVLLSAIYNEAIQKYESIMAGAKLQMHVSEIELFSSIRSVTLPDDKTVAVLDMGASSTRLYIVRNGLVHKTHSIPLSGEEMTRALNAELNVGFSKAEELKRMYGLSNATDDSRIAKNIRKTLERGIREIHTVASRYEESENVTLDKFVLSGGGALLRDLDSYVGDMFSRPVVFADPFSKVAYPAFLEDTLKEAGPSFAVAIGVALRSLQQGA